MELEGSSEAETHAAQLLDRFRRAGLPFVHVRHVALHPGATFFLPGTEGAEIRAGLAPLPGESVVVKHRPNAFLDTPLLSLLHQQDVQRLLLCGMMTHMCVDATVRAAADLGFECLVASQACATRSLVRGELVVPAAHVHAAFLAALDGTYARVMGTAEALREMVG